MLILKMEFLIKKNAEKPNSQNFPGFCAKLHLGPSGLTPQIGHIWLTPYIRFDLMKTRIREHEIDPCSAC